MATDHVSPASAAAESWALLEGFAWIGDVQNATTAVSKTSDNKHIQITFCPPRAPPHLSGFYIHSPDGANMNNVEPLIIATEDDLALLRVETRINVYPDYYVYQADDGSGKPSLTLLPPTPYIYFNRDIGLLRRPGNQYIVAGFRFLHEDFPDGGLALCVYDSTKGDWKVHDLSLSEQGRKEYGNKQFVHKNCKVLTIGGDAGTMAFVDLWRGVVFCDVLTLQCEAAHQAECKAIPLLGYVKLPDDLKRTARFKGDGRLYRDMALLNNHLKCFDLPSRSLWVRPASTSGAWSQKYMIRSFKEIANKNSRVNLLPGHKRVYRSFAGLNVCQPVVGLQDDDARIVYFTVKTDLTAAKGSVLALDLSTRKILGMAPFTARHKYDFNYVPTRLFKHLSGGNATLNQSGMVLQGSTSNMKDKAQEQLDGSVAKNGDVSSLANLVSMCCSPHNYLYYNLVVTMMDVRETFGCPGTYGRKWMSKLC